MEYVKLIMKIEKKNELYKRLDMQNRLYKCYLKMNN